MKKVVQLFDLNVPNNLYEGEEIIILCTSVGMLPDNPWE